VTARLLAAIGEALNNWSGYVVAATALIAVIGGKRTTAVIARWRDAFWGAVTSPFTAGPRSAAALEDFRAKSTARMDAILAELRPNGGASLRDSITRIEAQNAVALGRIDIVMVALGDQVAAYETDHAGLCVWTSPAYCDLVGRPAADLLGWGWIVALHHDDADHVRDCWRSSVDDRRAFEMRFRLVRPDGTPVPVLSRATPLFAGHRLIGWSGLMKAEEQVA
jgi:PAS domain S-box-containing protein